METILQRIFNDWDCLSRVKRPPNSYMLFQMAMRRSVASQFNITRNRELCSRLGNIWKYHTTAEVKEMFQNKALQLAELHKQRFPNYVYNPHACREMKKQKKKRKDEAAAAKEAKKNANQENNITEEKIQKAPEKAECHGVTSSSSTAEHSQSSMTPTCASEMNQTDEQQYYPHTSSQIMDPPLYSQEHRNTIEDTNVSYIIFCGYCKRPNSIMMPNSMNPNRGFCTDVRCSEPDSETPLQNKETDAYFTQSSKNESLVPVAWQENSPSKDEICVQPRLEPHHQTTESWPYLDFDELEFLDEQVENYCLPSTYANSQNNTSKRINNEYCNTGTYVNKVPHTLPNVNPNNGTEVNAVAHRQSGRYLKNESTAPQSYSFNEDPYRFDSSSDNPGVLLHDTYVDKIMKPTEYSIGSAACQPVENNTEYNQQLVDGNLTYYALQNVNPYITTTLKAGVFSKPSSFPENAFTVPNGLLTEFKYPYVSKLFNGVSGAIPAQNTSMGINSLNATNVKARTPSQQSSFFENEFTAQQFNTQSPDIKFPTRNAVVSKPSNGNSGEISAQNTSQVMNSRNTTNVRAKTPSKRSSFIEEEFTVQQFNTLSPDIKFPTCDAVVPKLCNETGENSELIMQTAVEERLSF